MSECEVYEYDGRYMDTEKVLFALLKHLNLKVIAHVEGNNDHATYFEVKPIEEDMNEKKV